MHLNAAIVEDNLNDLNIIKRMTADYSMDSNDELLLDVYSEPSQLLDAYQNGIRYNILFLDVEMPNMNGIDLANTIRKQWDKSPYIVFISSYPQYMSKSFNVRAFNYLTKPIDIETFFDTCNRIIEDFTESHTIVTVIDIDDSSEPIKSANILYIESIRSKSNYVCMHLVDHIVDCHGSLSHWNDTLCEYGFVQCFRSIIVNINHIHYIDTKHIILTNGERLPLSRIYKTNINKSFANTIKIFRR